MAPTKVTQKEFEPPIKMIIPRIGDYWEFRPTHGKKHTTKKRIVRIYWSPSKVTSRMCPWIEWSHTPKARYIGDIRVKYFLQERAVRLICRARAERR
jgi:hypothetical protein